MGGAGVGVPGDAVLAEDASLQERLHQAKDTLSATRPRTRAMSGRWSISSKHARDVAFYRPVVMSARQQADLGYGVLGSAPRGGSRGYMA